MQPSGAFILRILLPKLRAMPRISSIQGLEPSGIGHDFCKKKPPKPFSQSRAPCLSRHSPIITDYSSILRYACDMQGVCVYVYVCVCVFSPTLLFWLKSSGRATDFVPCSSHLENLRRQAASLHYHGEKWCAGHGDAAATCGKCHISDNGK